MLMLLTFDVAFFAIFIGLTFGVILFHRSHALHLKTRRNGVDGSYWGEYSTAATPAPVRQKKQDNFPRMVNGKLMLPKIQKANVGALAGKSTYAGRR